MKLRRISDERTDGRTRSLAVYGDKSGAHAARYIDRPPSRSTPRSSTSARSTSVTFPSPPIVGDTVAAAAAARGGSWEGRCDGGGGGGADN